MPDLTIDLDVTSIARATREMNSLAGAVGRLGAVRGGLSAGGTGVFGAAAPIVNPISAALGAIPAGLTEAATGLAILASAARQAAGVLARFGQVAFAGGGTPGETYGLTILGRAAGMDPLSLAYRLRAASLSGGLATGQMARAGYPIRPFDVGNPLDMAGETVRLFRRMSTMSRSELQGFVSPFGGIGMPELGPMAQAFGRHPQWLDDMDRINKDIFSDRNVDAAVHFNLEMAKLSTAFDQMRAALGETFLPALTGIVTLATKLMPILPWLLTGLGVVGVLSGNPIGMGAGAAAMALGAAAIGKQIYSSESQKALNSNTEAIRENTNTLRYVHGIHGGGAAAASAIPAAWRGLSGRDIYQNLQHGAGRLGAYAIGM